MTAGTLCGPSGGRRRLTGEQDGISLQCIYFVPPRGGGQPDRGGSADAAGTLPSACGGAEAHRDPADRPHFPGQVGAAADQRPERRHPGSAAGRGFPDPHLLAADQRIPLGRQGGGDLPRDEGTRARPDRHRGRGSGGRGTADPEGEDRGDGDGGRGEGPGRGAHRTLVHGLSDRDPAGAAHRAAPAGGGDRGLPL